MLKCVSLGNRFINFERLSIPPPLLFTDRLNINSERESGGNVAMREGTGAVFEALSWIEDILDDLEEDPDGVRKALREIRDAIEDIKKGVAVDFRHRLRGI
jgi:hypothetical protein